MPTAGVTRAVSPWQVEFFIVSMRALAAAPRPLTRAVLDGTDWWANEPFPADYHARLAAVSPAGPSLATHTERWGSDDGNLVEVRSTGGRVNRVMARVDVRRLDSTFGAALIVLVRGLGAVLIRGDGSVAEPTINAFAGALRGSTAWRFANDTAAFLAKNAIEEDTD